MRLVLAFCILSLTILTGCSQHNVVTDHNPKYKNIKLANIYLQKLPSDSKFNVYEQIEDELNLLGYGVSVGVENTPPGNVDATLRYADHWMWDISMYLLSLDMQLLEPKSFNKISETTVLRTSLIRKSRKDMAREALAELLIGEKDRQKYMDSTIRYSGSGPINKVVMFRDQVSKEYEPPIRDFLKELGASLTISEDASPGPGVDTVVNIYTLRGKVYLQFRAAATNKLFAEVFIEDVNSSDEFNTTHLLKDRLSMLYDRLLDINQYGKPFYAAIEK